MQSFASQTLLNSHFRSLRVSPQVAARPVRAIAQPPSLHSSQDVRRRKSQRSLLQAAAVEAPPAPTGDATEAAAPEVKVDEVLVQDIKVDPKAKYAVVELGGGQLLLEEGRWYTVNRLEAAVGSKIELKRVLAIKNEGAMTIGGPYLENVRIEAEILDEVKGPKLTIFKYRPKKHYRRKTGHRQPLTKFLVTKITP